MKWIITHRDNIENLTYDTLAGRILHIELATGRFWAPWKAPGHWLHATEGLTPGK